MPKSKDDNMVFLDFMEKINRLTKNPINDRKPKIPVVARTNKRLESLEEPLWPSTIYFGARFNLSRAYL